ncbi:MAG: hypothetical protein ACLFR0_01330 [Alphaproteobacteria bacterium]
MLYELPYRRGRACEIWTSAFFILLIIAVFIFTAFAVFDSPVILGTEKNANGLVEYLCLGSGCDNLQDMDW